MRIALSGLRAVIADSPGPIVDHGRRVDEVWFMSNLERSPGETACGGRVGVAVEPVRELMDGRPVALGGPRAMSVTRTLPNRTRRMVGAWCFVDYYGPDDVGGSPGGVPRPRRPRPDRPAPPCLLSGPSSRSDPFEGAYMSAADTDHFEA